MSIVVDFYEYGTNRLIGKIEMNADAVPRAGEYVIFDTEIKKNYQENMYIVKCVTNLLPKEHHFAGNKCIHIEKFNPEEEAKKIEELEAKLKQMVKGDKDA